jgi:pimeloyl-ACP methyl ester carboxylesterase
MIRLVRPLFLALLCACSSIAALAEAQLGVVLLHGKQSAPEEHAPIADALAAAGHLVERPEMCWSGRRIYDRPYLECLQEIDVAIERLRARGARVFVVAGHSLGANGALGYGARHKVAGVVALAPGHRPEVLARRPLIAEALGQAGKLTAQGAQTALAFPDFNGDLVVRVNATPETYLSFFAPDSPALMPANAAQLQAPLLYVIGTGDPLQRGPEELFAKAPPHPLNRFVTLRAGHFDTSAASSQTVNTWLRAVR